MNVIALSSMAASEGTKTVRAALLVAAFLLAGCVPVPTIPHGLGVVPDKAVFESFRPGEATRADVMLRLGEPKHRLEADRFLMYEWTVAYGYIGIYGPAPVLPVVAPHYLCLEFGPDSRLVRREPLTGSLYANPDKAIRTCTKQPEKTE